MLTKEKYNIIKADILLKLQNGLSKDLTYHSLQHTLDILKSAERIADHENIQDEQDLLLLKVACLYHDSGFLFTYKGHEKESCKLAKKDLHAFDFNKHQVDVICGLIMATEIPQNPDTKMEEIICDADLDYLGTPDFFTISNNLFLELKIKGLVNTKKEWYFIQEQFIEKHRYFTDTNKKLREQQKLMHLQAIQTIISN